MASTPFLALGRPGDTAEEILEGSAKSFRVSHDTFPGQQLLALIGSEQEHYFRCHDGQTVASDLARFELGAIDSGLSRQQLSSHLWEVLPTNHWSQRVERGAITAVAKWYDRETGWMRTLPAFVSELELRVKDTLVPLQPSSDVTLALSVTEDERHLVGGGRSGRVAVWRVEDGHLLHDFQVCRTPIIAIAATRDFKSVFFLTADGFLGISAIQRGDPAEQAPPDTRRESIGLFLAPGGEWVAAVARDGNVTQWNLQTGESMYEGRAPTPVHKVDFSASQDLRFITIEGPGMDSSMATYLWSMTCWQVRGLQRCIGVERVPLVSGTRYPAGPRDPSD